MKVYEILECEEYAWQESLGLFASVEAAKRHIPKHTVEIVNKDGFIIVALPEHAGEILAAMANPRASSYWWYDLPHHGRDKDYNGRTFYAISSREVTE